MSYPIFLDYCHLCFLEPTPAIPTMATPASQPQHHRMNWTARTSGMWRLHLTSGSVPIWGEEVLPLVTCSGNPEEIHTLGQSLPCSLFLLDQKPLNLE